MTNIPVIDGRLQADLIGFSGQVFRLATNERFGATLRIGLVERSIKQLFTFAAANPELTFQVPYNIAAGHPREAVLPLFADAPPNVIVAPL